MYRMLKSLWKSNIVCGGTCVNIAFGVRGALEEMLGGRMIAAKSCGTDGSGEAAEA